MKTIKLPYVCNQPSFYVELGNLQREQSSYTRLAYGQFRHGLSQKQVQQDETGYLKDKRFDHICSWFKQCALMEAKSIHKRSGEVKVIWGGRKAFMQRLSGKITKQEWQQKRLGKLVSQGEALKGGNRKFRLEVDKGQVIFKQSRGQHWTLELPSIRRNWLTQLLCLQDLTRLNATPFQVQLDAEHIWISFEPIKVETKIKPNRWLGIDMNPNGPGISVCEGSKDKFSVLFTKEYSLSGLIMEMKGVRLDSAHPKTGYYRAKLQHETIHIVKDIARLAKEWGCMGAFVEDLNFRQGDRGLGKGFNRLVNSFWLRNLFLTNLEGRLKLQGQKMLKVGAQYSSVIGNLMFDWSDAVNASVEICRRGLQCRIEKEKNRRKFYPDFSQNQVKDQWKELVAGCKDWKEVFAKIKNAGLRYRVSFSYQKEQVFSLNCKQSKVLVYNF